MNELTLKALVEAGAIKKIHVVADATHFYVDRDLVGPLLHPLTKELLRLGHHLMQLLNGYGEWVSAAALT